MNKVVLIYFMVGIGVSLRCLADFNQDEAEKQEQYQLKIPNAIGGQFLQLDKEDQQGSAAIKADGVDLKQYQTLADQGQPHAQFMLGLLYDQGIAVTQNYTLAIEWYQKSAVQGYAKAQYNLASMYDEGLGVKQNYSQAATWYQKAAEQNFAKAQFNLGSMYFNGEGVAQDNIQGYMWLKLAKAQGLGDKVKTRLSLVKNLGDSEIKKAKHLVKEWLASHKHLLAAK